MDKVYDHTKVEDALYKEWEEKGYFKPEINPDGKPFSIILPPPNANGALHFGHAMFTIEDILIRYHRMKGEASLWLPGADHAGIETQFVFEKKLKAEGKSRLDYTHEELFEMIHKYVDENRGGIESQLRRLGFSLDWSREKYTLDPEIVKLVHETFKKMHDDGLVYRDYKLVNYCTFDGTSFSDLEVVHEERPRPLYYIKYGPLVLATTRPETKFGDTAVAVHPDDARYQKFVGQELEIETVLGPSKIKVIADEMVDPNFGTGVVKITPAHDFADFETGKRHDLPMKQVIGFDGKMNELAGKFCGMYIKEARKAVVEKMQEKGLLEKIDEHYVTNLSLCYKCKNVLEPLPLEQWFIKVKPLAQKAIEVVKNGRVKIVPKSFESHYFQWLENLRDWNISRQIVWGIRIPAWKCLNSNNHPVIASETKQSINGEWTVTDGQTPDKCPICGSTNLQQDTDTFDTWFSSGQWPYVTLKTSQAGDFEKFYPTDVMETAYDILKAWVTRMVMLGVYITGEVPFRTVLFHGLVNDPYGKKMSKSKGNVVNPMELVDQYGADAVRFALVYGNATGNDQSLSYPKLEAARRFTNKLWNMARFIEMSREKLNSSSDPEFTEGESRSTSVIASDQNLHSQSSGHPELISGSHVIASDSTESLSIEQLSNLAISNVDKEWVEKTKQLISEVTSNLDAYQFNQVSEKLYEFVWHQFADIYIEDVKNRIDTNSFSILNFQFSILLKLLHPMMPFVTDEIYRKLNGNNDSIMIATWPQNNYGIADK